MNTYSVMIVGMGKRGKHYGIHFHNNKSFHIAGICDHQINKCSEIADSLDNPEIGVDASDMARSIKPDVFCICTPPTVRIEMIRTGIECGSGLIALEKPIALTSIEGLKINDLLSKTDTKVIVSHQHRYGKHYKETKGIIESGKIGKIHTVYGYSHGWAAHMLSHLIDYTMWFNKYVKGEWVMAQAAGKHKLSDVHASPDYIGGFVQFDNGVRGIYECGGGSPDVPEVERWWGKNRVGAIGTEGYAEVYTGNGWKAVTNKGVHTGDGCMNYDLDMPGYIEDIEN